MAVFTIGSKTLSGSPTGGAVGGASNLTTVGAIPYVSSSGVLNQDATKLFWDSANSRLGVGTASPSQAISIVGTSPVYLQIQGSGSNSYLGMVSGVQTMQSDGAIAFRPNSTESARFAATSGNLLIGGTTDGNYKLDIQKSGSTGTLRIYDQTATTGSTLAVIQAGAGQSGNLLSVRNNAGTELTYLASGGNINTDVTANFGTDVSFRNGGATQPAKLIASAPNNWLRMGQSVVIAWDNNTNAAGGSLDLGLARNAAGVLEINNGTAGTYRDLQARNITGTTTANGAPVTLTMSATGTGSDSQGTFLGSGAYLALKSTLASPYASLVFFKNSSTQTWRVGHLGSDTLQFLSGTAENSVANLTTSGTFTVFNQTAVTGSTLAVIQAGAGQSGNLLSVRNNAGTELAYVSSVGSGFFSSGIYVDIGGSWSAGPSGTRSRSDAQVAWSSTTNATATLDTGLKRAAGGYVAVTDGSTGLGKIVVSQSTPAASTDAGTAGAIWADANYIYVQTAGSTIKRVALTTF